MSKIVKLHYADVHLCRRGLSGNILNWTKTATVRVHEEFAKYLTSDDLDVREAAWLHMGRAAWMMRPFENTETGEYAEMILHKQRPSKVHQHVLLNLTQYGGVHYEND